jgi:hypothetical protein
MDEPSRHLPSTALAGHTLPDAGAVMKHAATGVRLVLSWDACAGSPAELRHRQVTPNHVLYEAGGEPIFGDGAPAHDEGFLDVPLEDVAAQLTPERAERMTNEFGSLETWARLQQPGLIGAANTVVPDGASGYFPPGGRRGRLVHEERSAGRHLVTAECVEFFRPRFDLARARRTIALSSAGVAWIVDDYRARTRATPPALHWQAYLRRGCALADDARRLRVRRPDGSVLATLAWAAPCEAVGLHRFPGYPAPSADGPLPWPDYGSERLRLVFPAGAPFAVCLVPGDAPGLAVTADDTHAFRAEWSGGSDVVRLPPQSCAG